jgi:two-component system response regulator RegA
MIVDDDEIQLRALARSAPPNVDVVTASDPAQAKRLADAIEPGLAVIDLRLGETWGIHLIESLRARHPLMTVVLISEFGTVDAALAASDEAMKAGADLVTTKPTTLRQLLAKLETARPASTKPLAVARVEYAERALRETGGNVSRTARTLGTSPSSLRRIVSRKPTKG